MDIKIGAPSAPSPPPRHVATPQELAQRRAPRDALVFVRLFGYTGTGLFAVCGARPLLELAIYLPARFHDKTVSVAFVLALVLVVVLLPMMAANLDNNYRAQARFARELWSWTVSITFAAVFWYSCFGEGEMPSRASVPRIFVLMLSVGSLAGAGVMCEWTLLATISTHRLAYGEAGAPSPAASASLGLVSSDGVFSPSFFIGWAETSLYAAPGGGVSAADAFSRYVAACRLNVIEPEGEPAFYRLLASHAATMTPAVRKTWRNGGRAYYAGLGMRACGEFAEESPA